ncbi:oligopeptide transporter-like protein [Trichodelitschia bisporula]|uniref:Oligopeptide transporter-like protein n=1 Tax=Trichodelitschia bisporula TaxID=703511 RepID=A0A6G1I6S4_9PEZI|nr:oligopeptide transporter-like protein [Trichodelitschia bisporula]
MAPDRGYRPVAASSEARESLQSRPEDAAQLLAARADEPQNFTLRGILVGTVIGVVILFSNTYFGLQTGWISGMSMPSALLGFAYFKTVSRWIGFPFTPVENVLVQSVSGAVGSMPLACGFVGVFPALNFLLTADENGPLRVGMFKLIVWALGVAFFGVIFAVPLRRQVIIREKLKFPGGTATALMISVLHNDSGDAKIISQTTAKNDPDGNASDGLAGFSSPEMPTVEEPDAGDGNQADWRAKIKFLLSAFAGSALYTLVTYFVPQIRDVPIFGMSLAQNWLWTLNPSPAYVGQGIIMGPATTLHMLLGAILGWGILSPLAKYQGWAPGSVGDWETGSKGWIVWVSLAIMLADSLVGLGWLALRPIVLYGPELASDIYGLFQRHDWKEVIMLKTRLNPGYLAVDGSEDAETPVSLKFAATEEEEADAPAEHLISNRTTLIGLLLSLVLCMGAVHYCFGKLMPVSLTLLSLFMALFLSVMGVRALGETDINPVSGISKITQLLFAFIVPRGDKNAIIINLLAGAISESGALQAGDLMQDLKTGHLLGAAPNAQFYGQLIGSTVGAVVSAVVYKLYTDVYTIPNSLFQVPTAYVWVFTARLVTGQGLPPAVSEWAIGAGLIFAATTAFRTWARAGGKSRQKFLNFVPGGIAVAVGMYNTPSFTLARAVGGVLSWYWTRGKGRSETKLVVLASGLILGEGLLSIVNLCLASLKVPHL